MPPSVKQVIAGKRADSPQGSEEAVKSFHVEIFWISALLNQL